MHKRTLILGGTLMAVGLLLIACSSPTPAPTVVVPPTSPPEPTSIPVPVAPPLEVPFEDVWAASPHADETAEAFVHWDNEDPKEVPTSCAKCHSTPGYRDFLGADGSTAGTVDVAAPTGTVISCVACHNDVTIAKTSVVFPSGVEITGLGDESRCMECHQGRASGATVDASIEKAGLTDMDTVGEDLGFTNIHYFAAAATKYGTLAQGGYQYAGKLYDARFDHVAGFNTCIQCHNPHSLEVKVESCANCHTGVTSVEDLHNVRMAGSAVDYDGDGNVEEGMYFEVEGMRELLLQAMQAYTDEVTKTPLAYNPAAYPYFFVDTNGDGQVGDDEANSDNAYKSWTGRLAKAAYNYQVSLKDPGAYAHGGKYIINLLYDSIDDLNAGLASPAVDLTAAHRTDSGHFAGSDVPFREWDENGVVPATCSKCHSAAGLPLFLKDNATITQPTANGFQCTTCHVDLETFARPQIASVAFPSGARVSFGENDDNNLCLNCHQGRESTTSVNRLTQGIEPDATSESLRFLNIHYFAAGATLFGTEAKGAYEYADQTYAGRNAHVERFDTCTECHDTHSQEVKVESCSGCHEGATSVEGLRTIRESEEDFDGDGDTDEGLAGEVDTLREQLYAAIQAYGQNAGTPIAYSSAAYPYWFADTNGNGTADPDEANRDNAFTGWTPRLLRAAYNYQYSTKDPGQFAHNGKYILQVLYDSLSDVGGDTTGMTRPVVANE